MKNLNLLSVLIILLLGFAPAHAQKKLKDKLKSKIPTKDNSAMYECGYVHELTLREKASITNMMIKGGGRGTNADMGTAAITVFYQAHLHPQNIVRFPTDIPGWETCGDAVFAGFTNKNGVGVSSIDGPFMIDDHEAELAGMGTYFHGFKPSERGTKTVKLSTSNGDKVKVEIGPAASLEILSIDGKSKGEALTIDGTKDIVIKLANGDAEPTSRLHVQMVCKLVGTPIIYDLYVTKARNTITIPKEAFKNFEGSPSPFMKNNTIIVNRVNEKVIDNTAAGALRTLSMYMDWMPVTVEGDIAKGNALTMGFDTSKNTLIQEEITFKNVYSFSGFKGNPYNYPGISTAKDVAIASFVVRGNLKDKTVKQVVMFDENGDLKKGTLTMDSQFSPALNSKEAWYKLANTMYERLENELKKEMGWNIRPLKEVTSSEAYKHTKKLNLSTSNTLVEVGAGGTKRILTTSSEDFYNDLGITFVSDYVSERIVRELGVNMVLAITVDLNMNATTQSLDTKVNIVAFAPNVSYKTDAKYFSMTGTVTGIRFDEDEKYSGAKHEKIYQMIQADKLIEGFIRTMNEISEFEKDKHAYQSLWDDRF